MKKSYHIWTMRQVNFFKKHFQEYTSKEFAAMFKVSENTIKSKRRQLGLIKDAASLKNIYRRPNAGHFRKGEVANNSKEENSITMRIEKAGFMYKWIKVGFRKWEMLHIYLWKKAGNKIPKGHVVRFKDKNTLNCVLSNLELCTRNKQLQINRGAYFEKEGRYYTKSQEKKLRERKIAAEKQARKKEFKKLRRRITKKEQQKITTTRKDLFIAPKRQEKSMPTRQVDLSKCVAVKIDRRTIVYVKPGADIEKIKTKYSRA